MHRRYLLHSLLVFLKYKRNQGRGLLNPRGGSCGISLARCARART
jgi:hypothetical protein